METVKRRWPYFVIIVVLSLIPLLGVILHEIALDFYHYFFWTNEELHTAIEASGAIIAIFMALILLVEKSRESNKYFFLAMGFLSMGILDGLHSCTPLGDRFVYLHSLAVLNGGFWFALVWIPETRIKFIEKVWLPWVIVVFTLLQWVWSLAFPTALPMLINESFSNYAIYINLISGVLFLIASLRFIVFFYRTSDLESFLFACLAILYGMAGISFRGSILWNYEWWLWHLLRLTAYILVIGFLFYSYRTLVKILQLNLIKQKKIEEELRELSERFLIATESAQIGVYDWDIKNDVLIWDDIMYRVYGVKKENFSGAYEAWRGGVHPDDVEQAEKEVQLALTGEKEFATEFRIVWPNGSVKYIQAAGYVSRDKDGSPLRLIGANWDISVRKDAENAIKKANEELKGLDERKSAFVAKVSHELKNPLFNAQESLHLILEGELGEVSEKQMNILEIANKNISRLLRLVADLLDISKIESGKMEIKRERVEIDDLFDEVKKSFNNEITRKRLAFNIDISPNIGFVWGDRDKLFMVMGNLISNAIKYTPDEGELGVKVWEIVGGIHFEFYDSGPGISRSDFGKIFDKFERISAEKTEGTGLGLPIAKDIVELHKGRIWVESELGRGCQFFITLPRDFRRS